MRFKRRRSQIASLLFFSVLLTDASASSTCYGTPKEGRLVDGVQLPRKGDGFEAYSWIGHFLGRTYVHDIVRDVVLAAYTDLARNYPGVVYVFGETGWKNGGRFWPHKSHENGLSVDFMVPVRNDQNKSIPIPCSPLNKFCYSIEFDRSGKYKDLRIDFDAIASHLIVLQDNAKKLGVKIGRVIFDPDLTELLKASKTWVLAKPDIYFSPHKPWVRHDEHYHIDFEVSCSP